MEAVSRPYKNGKADKKNLSSHIITWRLIRIKVSRSYKYVLIYLKSSLIIIKGKMPGYGREEKQNSMKEHLYQYLTNRIF